LPKGQSAPAGDRLEGAQPVLDRDDGEVDQQGGGGLFVLGGQQDDFAGRGGAGPFTHTCCR